LAATALLFSVSFALSHIPASQHGETDAQPTDAAQSTGSPILIRIFKRESELELWMHKGTRFQLHATYPICYWSGNLGPKEREGDRQAPEGFYAVSADQMRIFGRHPRALDIGFPNAFDRALGRSGSHILVHGGCTSIGCFAMTDAVMENIFWLSDQALRQGQPQIPVHIFPFRMTDANLMPYVGSKWYGFWQNLKEGYDAFEASRLPPSIGICRDHYLIEPSQTSNTPSKTNIAFDACAPDGAIVASRAPTSEAPRVTAQRPMANSYLQGPSLSPAKRFVPRRVLLSVGAHSVRTTALATPRDSLGECVRLWSRETRVTQHQWHEICRRLDFSPSNARVRTR
jgi:murein L,D-transpeptidase YafK